MKIKHKKRVSKNIDIVRIHNKIFEFFDSEYRIPNDITKITPKQVRNLHSYWGNQYVYCQNIANIYESELKQKKLSRKKIYNRRFILTKKYRVANDLARSKAENNRKIIKLDEDITEIEVNLHLWFGLIETCKTYMNICSREQSWRQVEYDSYKKRLGQGK